MKLAQEVPRPIPAFSMAADRVVVALGGEIWNDSANKQNVTSVTTCHVFTRAACDATKDPVFATIWALAGVFQAQKVGAEV